jgi:hypothetical protein
VTPQQVAIFPPTRVKMTLEAGPMSDPCHVWLGAIDNQGYPRRMVQQRHANVHHEMYVLHHGEVPEGFVVHHICERMACVNPNHLELLSRAEHCRLHRPGDFRVYA